MRRFVARILSLCLLPVLLWGCGAERNEGTVGTKTTGSEEGHFPYVLRLLAQVTPNKETTYQKLVEGFLERYPYFTVTVDTARSAQEMERMATETGYDVLFFEESSLAEALYDRAELVELEEFWQDHSIDDRISNLILPQWEIRYAIPLFLKVSCIFSKGEQVSQEPVDYAAWLAENQSELPETIMCTGLATGAKQTAAIDCTCVALGSRGDRKNGEFFLQILYRQDFLPECIARTALPLACRVTLSEVQLPPVTADIYKLLADTNIRLEYKKT